MNVKNEIAIMSSAWKVFGIFQYVAFKTNPYVWSVNSQSLNAPSQELEVIDCNSRQQQTFQNATDDPFRGETYITVSVITQIFVTKINVSLLEILSSFLT